MKYEIPQKFKDYLPFLLIVGLLVFSGCKIGDNSTVVNPTNSNNSTNGLVVPRVHPTPDYIQR